ncbi:MAG: IS630 family transposase [Terriglobia bacterium]
MAQAGSPAPPCPGQPSASGRVQKKLPQLLQEALTGRPPAVPVRLLFQDEARFGRLSDERRCWAPWPERPCVGKQIIREYTYGLVAVSPHDGKFSSPVLPWVDAEAMSVFLAQTAADFPGDYCLILLDGAGWHRAAALRIPARLRLLPLPPYSPELNPVEHIWEHLRENYFGNRVFPSLSAVVDQLCAGLHDLDQHPDVVKSMTNFDWINTLSMMSN